MPCETIKKRNVPREFTLSNPTCYKQQITLFTKNHRSLRSRWFFSTYFLEKEEGIPCKLVHQCTIDKHSNNRIHQYFPSSQSDHSFINSIWCPHKNRKNRRKDKTKPDHNSCPHTSTITQHHANSYKIEDFTNRFTDQRKCHIRFHIRFCQSHPLLIQFSKQEWTIPKHS